MQDTSFIKNISAPIYSKNEQHKILSAAINVLNLSLETVNFIYLLAKNKRLSLLNQIVNHLKILFSENIGNKLIEVTTSNTTSTSEQKIIQEQLEEIFSCKVKLYFKKDKEIYGGLIIKCNNQMFDASLKTKFINLTNNVTKEIALL